MGKTGQHPGLGRDEEAARTVKRLLARINVGEISAAQTGYALKKIGEREWIVVWVANTQQAREALERTKRVCELLGVDVRSVSGLLGLSDVPSYTTCWNCGLEQKVIVEEGWPIRCRRCGRLLSSPQRRRGVRKVMMSA